MKERNFHTGKMIKIGHENRNNIKKSTYFFIIYNVKAKAAYYLNKYCKKQISTASLQKVSTDLLT